MEHTTKKYDCSENKYAFDDYHDQSQLDDESLELDPESLPHELLLDELLSHELELLELEPHELLLDEPLSQLESRLGVGVSQLESRVGAGTSRITSRSITRVDSW